MNITSTKIRMSHFKNFLMFVGGTGTLIVTSMYVTEGLSLGYWSIPKQIEYQKLVPELINFADRNGDHELSTQEEIRDVRRRAGLEVDKDYIWLTPNVVGKSG